MHFSGDRSYGELPVLLLLVLLLATSALAIGTSALAIAVANALMGLAALTLAENVRKPHQHCESGSIRYAAEWQVCRVHVAHGVLPW